MSDAVKILTVDESNVDELGFFCYKSKPASDGYQNKLEWLKERFAEGMVIKIIYEGARSVGFIEYIPAEKSWRAVEAPGYMVIHCLWVVGKCKKKGYGSKLLHVCVKDTRRMGKHGVVMVTSQGNWVANKKVFLKNGFEIVDTAPPAFELLVKRLGKADAPAPAFPRDWSRKAASYGSGMTVVYSDQCPYIPDAVSQAREAFEKRGVKTRAVKLESSEAARSNSPSAYGVFGIVHEKALFSYHYLGKKEVKKLDDELRS
jgi:ribosomal protein S18 acetylase RimI-like enzyme